MQSELVPPAPAVQAPAFERDFTALVWRDRAFWVVLLGALTAVGALTIDLYLPAFPEIRSDLRAGHAAVQLSLTGMLVGLAVGQLVIGPLSDALGRRRPLLAGLAVHCVASVACIFAPTIEVLALTRFCQGLGVAAASVSALAVVRDRFDGHGATRLMARLMLIIGVSPIFAPGVGSVMLAVTGWRGIFAVLAVVSSCLGFLVYRLLPETLPPSSRRLPGVRSTLAAYREVAADRPTLWLVCVAGLATASVFAYAAGSSFVFQEQFDLSSRGYGVIFAIGGCCLITGGLLAGSFVRRFGPRRLLGMRQCGAAVSATLLLVGSATGWCGVLGVAVPVCAFLFSFGIGQPTVPSLALRRHRNLSGTTVALIGAFQFTLGSAASPLVSAFPVSAAVGMSLVIAVAMVLSLCIYLRFIRPLADPV